MVVGFISTFVSIQSVPIITKVVSWNPAHGEVYSIQTYMIKFVSDLQISHFLQGVSVGCSFCVYLVHPIVLLGLYVCLWYYYILFY
jgi:hypothetical protein